jgi:GAF domain-containing protein
MIAKEQDYFSAFVTISKAISSTLKLNEVLDLILKHAVSSLDLKAGAISLLDAKKNRLQLIANYNLSQDYLDKGPVAADKSMPGAIFNKRPVVVSNVKTDTQLQYPEACEKEGIGSILSVPILFRDKVIGVLRLYGGEPREFTYREVEFISALADQGGIAIENARYMEKVMNDHKQEVEELTDWFDAMTSGGSLDG